MARSVSYKEIARIALPIMVSGLSVHMIGLIDTIFLARLGDVALGAAGNSTLLYYTSVVSLSGLTLGTQIIIGRRNGEGNLHEVGTIFYNSIWLVLALGIFTFFALQLGVPQLVDTIYASEAIANTTVQFMDIRIYGIYPTMINFVCTALLVGTTQTRVLAFISPAIAVVNIALDYLLIFGVGVFPEWGVQGAALASVIAEGFGSICFIVFILTHHSLKPYQLGFKLQLDLSILQKIWKVGSPVVLQYFVAMSAWFIFFTIIERLSERALAVSHIVRALYMVLGIPLTAWSDAANTIVSNLIGEKKTNYILPTLRKIAGLLLVVDLFYCLVINVYPIPILSLFSNDETLILDAIPTLRVISVSLIFFSLAFLSFRALAGSGLTKLCMKIEVFTVAVYLLSAFALIQWFNPSTALVWCTEFVYFGLLGLISLWYLWRERYNTADF